MIKLYATGRVLTHQFRSDCAKTFYKTIKVTSIHFESVGLFYFKYSTMQDSMHDPR